MIWKKPRISEKECGVLCFYVKEYHYRKEGIMSKEIREIEANFLGKKGLFPKEKDSCIYKGEVPCVSDIGGYICDGFEGIKDIPDRDYVLCSEKVP
jgi:hypothetical protein